MRSRWIVMVVGTLGMTGCATTGSAVGAEDARRAEVHPSHVREWRSLRDLQGDDDRPTQSTLAGIDY